MSTFNNVVSSMPDMSTLAAWVGLALSVFTLSYFATTIDAVKKLREGKTVPETSIQFVYTISSVALFVAVIALLVFILTLYKMYKR